jgi:hypothetical protein
MTVELQALLPRDKHQIQMAQALVRVGYPEIAPVLSEILEWVQDMNWPVARVFQPMLASIGAPLAPIIRPVLNGNDDVWKYSIVNNLVRESPSLAYELHSELERLVKNPSVGELDEGVSEVARELLGLPAAKNDV